MTRRRFLAGSTAAAVLAVACTKDAAKTGAAGDIDTATTAAGLEKLAYDSYKAASDLLTAGKLGAAVPAAVAAFFVTAGRHHELAMEGWNTLLTDRGRPAVTAPREALRELVDGAMARATDVPALATVALRLEDYTSRTYQKALPVLTTPEAIGLAAQVDVVGQQRQATLRYLLGLYPVGAGTSGDPLDAAPANPARTLLTG